MDTELYKQAFPVIREIMAFCDDVGFTSWSLGERVGVIPWDEAFGLSDEWRGAANHLWRVCCGPIS